MGISYQTSNRVALQAAPYMPTYSRGPPSAFLAIFFSCLHSVHCITPSLTPKVTRIQLSPLYNPRKPLSWTIVRIHSHEPERGFEYASDSCMRVLTTQIGFCKAARHDTGQCVGGKVHGSSLDATIELISYHLLSVTVGEEVDRAGRYYTGLTWAPDL